jgi:hypothetical protein
MSIVWLIAIIGNLLGIHDSLQQHEWGWLLLFVITSLGSMSYFKESLKEEIKKDMKNDEYSDE